MALEAVLKELISLESLPRQLVIAGLYCWSRFVKQVGVRLLQGLVTETSPAVARAPTAHFQASWGQSLHDMVGRLWFFTHDNPIPFSIHYSLRPSAKDQGITWVVIHVHHLVHFLLKINISENNFSLPGTQTGVFLLPSQALYQLSYGNIDTNCWKIIYLT